MTPDGFPEQTQRVLDVLGDFESHLRSLESSDARLAPLVEALLSAVSQIETLTTLQVDKNGEQYRLHSLSEIPEIILTTLERDVRRASENDLLFGQPAFYLEQALDYLQLSFDSLKEWALQALERSDSGVDRGIWHTVDNGQPPFRDRVGMVGAHRLMALEALSRNVAQLVETEEPQNADRARRAWSQLLGVVDGLLSELLADVFESDYSDVPLSAITNLSELLTDAGSGDPAADQIHFSRVSDLLDNWLRSLLLSARSQKLGRRRRVIESLRQELRDARSQEAAFAAELAKEETERLTAVRADDVQGGYFDTLANKLRFRGWLLLMGSVLLVAGSIFVVLLGFRDADTGWQESLVRLGYALPLLLLGAYFARESSADRRSEDSCRRLATQLKTFAAFIKPLPLEQQQLRRDEFGRVVFGSSAPEPVGRLETLPVEVVRAVESLVRAVQERGTGENSKPE